MCVKGASLVQTKVLDRIDSDQLKVFVVWTPRFNGDNRNKAIASMEIVPDKRATHFWDRTSSISAYYGAVLKLPERAPFAWDVYFVFDDQAEWKEDPPRPDHWMHQLGGVLGRDHPRFFDGDKFRGHVLETLKDRGKERPSETTAIFGADFRALTNAETKRFGLTTREGQIVESIVANGRADAAGIRKGDAILKLDENAISSTDALLDFLRVTKPGHKVRVKLKRAGSLKTEEVHVELGRRGPTAETARESRFTWDYAGLAQLDQALASAKKHQKLVLVGLSGAET